MKANEKLAEIKAICDSPTEEEPKVEIVSEVRYGTKWADFPSFKPSEFTCPCGKCDMSKAEGVEDMDYKLLFILQSIRNKYGKPVVITSGARCKTFNASLSNADANSYHMKKKAADFYIAGITSTEKGRNEVVAYLKTLAGFKYAYHNVGGKYQKMGSAVHIEVK